MWGKIRTLFVLVSLFGALAAARTETSSSATPVDFNTALEQADQLISVERLDEALALLKSIDTVSPKATARIEVLLGKIYLRLQKPGKAADLFEHAAMSSLEDAEAYLGLAQAKLALGNLLRARQHARTALRTNPDLIGGHLVLAKVDDRNGQISETRSRFSRLMKQQPDSEPVVVAYALFMSQRDNTDLAEPSAAGTPGAGHHYHGRGEPVPERTLSARP